ncbi:MAG: DUF2892 domain-containing protein [Candidatus Micrarchaeota archaeon]|nr:DUF2892 domain-containing protein [Candidatus Micrarchaeota archaeon]
MLMEFKFEKNVGSLDRFFRFSVGLMILIGGTLAGSWLALFGLVPIFTATTRFCPMYTFFGINTCIFDKSK